MAAFESFCSELDDCTALCTLLEGFDDNIFNDEPLWKDSDSIQSLPTSNEVTFREEGSEEHRKQLVRAGTDEKDEQDSQSSKEESRPERKRRIEQKRRNEVNEGFDYLTEIIFCIDPQVRRENVISLHLIFTMCSNLDYFLLITD